MLFLMRSAAVLSALLIFTSQASAVVVIPGSAADPVADTFGSLPAATFGGTGIPNSAVAISTTTIGPDTITLGIAATPRFSSPMPLNDGMGAYTVLPGESAPGLSLWNFSFYTDIDGPGTFADYRFELDYDLDSGFGTAIGDHGTLFLNTLLAINAGPLAPAFTSTVEGSENLGFGFLTTPVPFAISPPIPTPVFDPNATGEYTFEIRVYDSLVGGSLVDKVSMSVTAVPEASAVLCFATLSCVIGVMHRRKKPQSSDA